MSSPVEAHFILCFASLVLSDALGLDDVAVLTPTYFPFSLPNIVYQRVETLLPSGIRLRSVAAVFFLLRSITLSTCFSPMPSNRSTNARL